MLAFLLRVAASSHLPKAKAMEEEDKTGLSAAIYFDILVHCNYRNFIMFSCLDT